MNTKKITIAQINAMIDASLKHDKIIQNLEMQKQNYGCDTDEPITKRNEILKKLEAHLEKISGEKNLEISSDVLVHEINSYLKKGEKARISDGPSKFSSDLIIIISQDGKALKEYLIAPFVSFHSRNINLLEAVPSSINANYSAIFDDYPKIDKCFYTALAKTIKNNKLNDETRLIENYININKYSKDSTTNGILLSDIMHAKNINKKLNDLPEEKIRLDDILV